MITCSHVGMRYDADRDILTDVNFTLEKGGFYFLSGPSGTGKTTLLSLLALTKAPTKGAIHMFGKEVTRLPRDTLPRLRRRIGMVSQDYKLLPHLSVEDNVGLPLKLAGETPKEIHAKVSEMLAWVGLKDYHKARPEALSGGQKQRVAIARSVITRPDVLLCDEPSGNLEAALTMRFMYLFEQLNKMGATVLLATHDEWLIEQFKYPVLRLKDGVVTG